jgi:hypothetical protein
MRKKLVRHQPTDFESDLESMRRRRELIGDIKDSLKYQGKKRNPEVPLITGSRFINDLSPEEKIAFVERMEDQYQSPYSSSSEGRKDFITDLALQLYNGWLLFLSILYFFTSIVIDLSNAYSPEISKFQQQVRYTMFALWLIGLGVAFYISRLNRAIHVQRWEELSEAKEKILLSALDDE